ncbi:MAG: hypothetical protein WBX25_07105 [Rhodomicrobium sp.]
MRRFPNLVPDNPDADGAALSRRARDWLRNSWQGETFMAIGMKDPVLGAPAMNALAKIIRGCPPPLEIEDAGHFVQGWGVSLVLTPLERMERFWRKRIIKRTAFAQGSRSLRAPDGSR